MLSAVGNCRGCAQTDAMQATKEKFIKTTGGFRVGDTEQSFLARTKAINDLELRLKTSRLNEVEGIIEEIRKLKGLPPDEWDYKLHD